MLLYQLLQFINVPFGLYLLFDDIFVGSGLVGCALIWLWFVENEC